MLKLCDSNKTQPQNMFVPLQVQSVVGNDYLACSVSDLNSGLWSLLWKLLDIPRPLPVFFRPWRKLELFSPWVAEGGGSYSPSGPSGLPHWWRGACGTSPAVNSNEIIYCLKRQLILKFLKKIPKENIHYISLLLKYVSAKNLIVLKKKNRIPEYWTGWLFTN